MDWPDALSYWLNQYAVKTKASNRLLPLFNTIKEGPMAHLSYVKNIFNNRIGFSFNALCRGGP